MSEPKGPARRRRSVLYAPASNPRAMEKARTLACDGVILDLEDSVDPEAKPEARRAAVEALAAGFGGRETMVRCNGLRTPWGEADLSAAAGAGADGVLLPKVETLDDVLEADRRLASAPAKTRLWVMIETAKAVLNLKEISAAAAFTRLEGLVLGPNDLTLELGLRPSGPLRPMRPILSQIGVAARANGLSALGGAFTGLDDRAGFEAECREEAAFGFDGKTLVHPSQIDPCNLIFSPSEDELAWAQAVVEAFAGPDAEGKAVLRLRGRMIERLHLRWAEDVLARSAHPQTRG